MNVNACIFDNEGRLAGCVTPSVIAKFQEEMLAIWEKAGEDPELRGIAGALAKIVEASGERLDAGFLNGLKAVIRRQGDSFYYQEFIQQVGESYHKLVSYCCSNVVYDEVLSESISFFADYGFTYIGNGMIDLDYDVYTFDASGVTVGIEMRAADKLYGLWRNDGERRVVVIMGDKRVMMAHTGMIESLCTAIWSCIEDFSVDEPFEGTEHGPERVKLLVEVAKRLLDEFKKEAAFANGE